MEAPDDLRSDLRTVGREKQLRFIAWTIHGFTIMARDPDASEDARAKINNLIHYLSGHLAGLTRPDEEWLDRENAVIELFGHLNRGLARNVIANLNGA